MKQIASNDTDFKFVVEQLLSNIHLELNLCIQQFCEPFGLTVPQAMILLYIRRNGRGKVTEVAQNLRMTNSNLSTICRRLERDGYITRTRDLEDQRIVWIDLTEGCIEHLEELQNLFDNQYLDVFKELSQKEKNDILKVLTRLESILSKACH